MGSTVDGRIADLLKRGSRDEQLAGLCALGRELMTRDDLEGALTALDRAVRLDGRSPAAWSLRGEVLARKNRAGEALGCFERALATDASNVNALVGKADLLLRLGSPAEALGHYELASKLCPEVTHVWLKRARALEGAGREENAVESLDRALALSEAAPTWLERGNLLIRLNKSAEAKRSFERAVDLDPAALDAWYALALVAGKLQDFESVRRACARYLDAAPRGDVRVSAVRSLLFQLDRHGPQAPQPRVDPHHGSRADTTDTGAPTDLSPESGAVVSRFRADADAARDSEPGATGQRGDPRPTSTVDSSSTPGAAADVSTSDASSDAGDGGYESTLAELISADALHRAGRHIEALRKVETLVRDAPTEVNAWLLRARILLALGKPDLAARSAEDAVALDGASLRGWKLLGRACVATKKYERGLEALTRAEELAPTDGELFRLRGDCLLGADRHTEAVYAFEKAIHYGETDPESWLALGRVLRLLRRANAAREPLERARDLAEAAGRSDVAAEAKSLLTRLG